MTSGRPSRIPSPEAHRRGTLRTFDRFRSVAGPHPDAPRIRMLLARPDAVVAPPGDHENSLKYDLYLTRRADGGFAWGATVNDRWEGAALYREVELLAREWSIDLGGWQRLRRAVSGASPALTVAAGMDDPGRRPRLKLYLQEDVWSAGLGTASSLAGALTDAVPGCALPDWLEPDRVIGVVTLVLRGSGPPGLKAYLGGASPQEAARGAPEHVLELADRFARLCPLPRSWYYLTVRLDPGLPPRYAINKIYNHVQVGFEGDPGLLDAAWAEIEALFAATGTPGRTAALRGGQDEVIVVPTASAWEAGGRSADVYCGSWALKGASGR
jgi:hypothetical protein